MSKLSDKLSGGNKTWYAWSNIVKKSDATGRPLESIKPGEVVNPDDYPEDWEYFVTHGVVRTKEYPDLSNFEGSPNDYFKKQLAESDSLDVYDANDRLVPAGAEVPEN